jgi:hypothetical protein
MTAWVLVRNKTWWSTALFLMFVAAMVIPFQVVMFPLITWFRDLGNFLHLLDFHCGGFVRLSTHEVGLYLHLVVHNLDDVGNSLLRGRRRGELQLFLTGYGGEFLLFGYHLQGTEVLSPLYLRRIFEHTPHNQERNYEAYLKQITSLVLKVGFFSFFLIHFIFSFF